MTIQDRILRAEAKRAIEQERRTLLVAMAERAEVQASLEYARILHYWTDGANWPLTASRTKPNANK